MKFEEPTWMDADTLKIYRSFKTELEKKGMGDYASRQKAIYKTHALQNFAAPPAEDYEIEDRSPGLYF